jgi:hypothetical protein
MATARMIVFTIPTSAGESEELDRWYDEQHVPDLLAVPGVVGAQRFDLRKIKSPQGSPEWQFLAIYRIEADDIDAVFAEMNARMGTPRMPRSAALDSSKTLAYMATEKVAG